MSGRLGRLLVFGAVAVVVFGIVFAIVRSRSDEPGVRGLAAPGDAPFGASDEITAAFGGALSQSGNRLAVLTSDGLGLVQRNRIEPITERGAHVVDVAWFPNDATVLVAEGPTPTGLLAVVDVDDGGKVRGSIRLDPSVGFGQGYGMSVAPGGRKAVVSAVDRPPLGPEQRHLVTVDLVTGATSILTPPDGPDEDHPVHLDEHRVAFVQHDGAQVRTRVVDVRTGAIADLVDGAQVVGVWDGSPVVVGGDGRLTVSGRSVGAVPSGATVVGVDVGSKLAVVVESTPAGTRLRRIAL